MCFILFHQNLVDIEINFAFRLLCPCKVRKVQLFATAQLSATVNEWAA